MEDEMANLLQQGGQRFQKGGQRLQQGGQKKLQGGRRGGCAQRGGANLDGEPVGASAGAVQGNDAMSSLGFSLYGGKRRMQSKGKPKSSKSRGKSRRKSRGKTRSKVFPNGLFGKLMR
jgi:hypothetical protein